MLFLMPPHVEKPLHLQYTELRPATATHDDIKAACAKFSLPRNWVEGVQDLLSALDHPINIGYGYTHTHATIGRNIAGYPYPPHGCVWFPAPRNSGFLNIVLTDHHHPDTQCHSPHGCASPIFKVTHGGSIWIPCLFYDSYNAAMNLARRGDLWSLVSAFLGMPDWTTR